MQLPLGFKGLKRLIVEEMIKTKCTSWRENPGKVTHFFLFRKMGKGIIGHFYQSMLLCLNVDCLKKGLKVRQLKRYKVIKIVVSAELCGC
jgi:hypothetical protein